jgi:lipid-A-disaccharide synthase
VAPGHDPGLFDRALDGLRVARIVGRTHDLLSVATLGLVASGTATVEAALLETPMIVVYRLSALTYALGRPFVRVPHYAMANLIAGREVVRELIQSEFRPDTVAAEALALLETPGRLTAIRTGLAEVKRRLGPPGASGRAAEVVVGILRRVRKP